MCGGGDKNVCGALGVGGSPPGKAERVVCCSCVDTHAAFTAMPCLLATDLLCPEYSWHAD